MPISSHLLWVSQIEMETGNEAFKATNPQGGAAGLTKPQGAGRAFRPQRGATPRAATLVGVRERGDRCGPGLYIYPGGREGRGPGTYIGACGHLPLPPKIFYDSAPRGSQGSLVCESLCTGQPGPRSNPEPICAPSKNKVFDDLVSRR